MDSKELESRILAAVEEYLEATEAWDDAQLVIDSETGKVSLMEEEETEELADSNDVYDIMDFIEMTSEGDWKADRQVIKVTAAEYAN